MPDPTTTNQIDPSQTVEQTVTTPELELFSPKPSNWQLVGDALARRRGLLPSLLGSFMSDYGQRKTAQQTIPALEDVLKSEGSPLTADQLKAIGGMDPRDALQQLSIWQKKALEKKAKTGPPGLFYNELAKQPEENPWQYLDKQEGPLPKGMVPYGIEKERILAKDKEKQTKSQFPKSYFQAFADSQDPNNPNAAVDARIADAWRQRQNEDNRQRAYADAQLRATATNEVMMQQPLARIPGQSGFVPIDMRTGKPVYGLTGNEFFKGLNQGLYGRARNGDLSTISGLKEVQHTLDTLTNLTNDVLPPGSSDNFRNIFKRFAGKARLMYRAAGGDVNAQQYMNMSGTGLGLQVQKLLTGSTRPVNLVEFQRVTGMQAKGDGAFGGLNSEQVNALVPTPYDTREQALAKIKFLRDTARNREEELSGYIPPENPLLNKLDAPDASPDKTGIGPDTGDEGESTDY